MKKRHISMEDRKHLETGKKGEVVTGLKSEEGALSYGRVWYLRR